MDVVALDVLQILVVTGNIEEAKSSSAIFFLPCPQNRATLGQIVQIVITTKSTTKVLLERRGASLQREGGFKNLKTQTASWESWRMLSPEMKLV